MSQWLYCKHLGGTSDTLGKLGTLDSLHYADPGLGMTLFAKGTSRPTIPQQHKLSLHHESSASIAAGPTDLEFGASIPYC